MIRVKLQDADGDWDEIVPMFAVPRVGEQIETKAGVFKVVAVLWTPFERQYAARVRFS
jgi:hypothetical protein